MGLGFSLLRLVLTMAICSMCKASLFVNAMFVLYFQTSNSVVEQGKRDGGKSKVLILTKYNNDTTWIKIKAIVSTVGEEESDN